MSIMNILEIIVVIICAIIYGFMLYFKVKGNITEGISELIALAEKTGLPGNEKMSQVVDEMYKKVPMGFRKILNKKELEKLAQLVFDWMHKYAYSYMDSVAEESK